MDKKEPTIFEQFGIVADKLAPTETEKLRSDLDKLQTDFEALRKDDDSHNVFCNKMNVFFEEFGEGLIVPILIVFNRFLRWFSVSLQRWLNG